MTNDEFRRITPRDGDPAAAEPSVRSVVNPPKSAGPSRKTAILGSLVVGGIAGAAILGPLSTLAASPSPAASGTATSPTETTTPTATSTPAASDDNEANEPQGRGGHTEAVSDASVVAKAIGISEADLLTALSSGQTAAQVATAHGVPVQTVIDALVADGESELAAEVASGQITQAQADAEKADVTQRATDQVNGSLGAHH